MALLANLLAAPGRLAFGAGVVAVSVAGVAGLSSTALFTDTQGSGDTSITTGTVQIDPDSTSSTKITVTKAAPGSSWSRDYVVENTGNLELKYKISSSVSGDTTPSLAGQLTAKLVTGTCASQATTVGTTLFNGAFGSIAYGTWTTLAAGDTDELCLTVGLPLNTDNTFQGLGPVVNNLQFAAEQTANN